MARAIAYLVAIQKPRQIKAFAELGPASALTFAHGAAKHGPESVTSLGATTRWAPFLA